MKNKSKKPTLEEKVKMYENFLHTLNMYMLCGSNYAISKLLQNADNWSYAHRMGDGELSEEEIEMNVNKRFWKLLDVPDTKIHKNKK
jgi:hypothetical protein